MKKYMIPIFLAFLFLRIPGGKEKCRIPSEQMFPKLLHLQKIP